jgi:hypothetical protein
VFLFPFGNSVVSSLSSSALSGRNVFKIKSTKRNWFLLFSPQFPAANLRKMELIFYSVRDNYNVIDSIKRRGLGKKKSHDEFIAAETTAIHNSGPAPDA